MREILFRGKRVSNGEWVIGGIMKTFHPNYDYKNEEEFLSQKPNCYCICANNKDFFVEQSSIGEFTGLTDKNGNKIFEGDIVKNDWCFLNGYSVVKFGQYKPLDMNDEYQQGHLGFYLEHIHETDKRTSRKDIMFFANKCEVIGNIHDNPELLGGGK
ncbi:MAG: hypothetical protein II304_10595 [Bacteroidales bacterium]|nr:hypothetical protein [Bacteroidales bacterium]